jgi:hypothetical protein
LANDPLFSLSQEFADLLSARICYQIPDQFPNTAKMGYNKYENERIEDACFRDGSD